LLHQYEDLNHLGAHFREEKGNVTELAHWLKRFVMSNQLRIWKFQKGRTAIDYDAYVSIV